MFVNFAYSVARPLLRFYYDYANTVHLDPKPISAVSPKIMSMRLITAYYFACTLTPNIFSLGSLGLVAHLDLSSLDSFTVALYSLYNSL